MSFPLSRPRPIARILAEGDGPIPAAGLARGGHGVLVADRPGLARPLGETPRRRAFPPGPPAWVRHDGPVAAPATGGETTRSFWGSGSPGQWPVAVAPGAHRGGAGELGKPHGHFGVRDPDAGELAAAPGNWCWFRGAYPRCGRP